MKIAIIYGVDAATGSHPDPEIRQAVDILIEIKNIQRILNQQGYETALVRFDFDVLDRVHELVEYNPDLIFNFCEVMGDESNFEVQMASVLELLRLPFTGSGSCTLALCLNKLLAKMWMNLYGIPTPRHVVIEPGSPIIKADLKLPLIVKPVHEDGSLGIDEDSVVHDDQALKSKIFDIHQRFRQGAIVEEFIDGREFYVSILGNDPFEFVQIREFQFLSPKTPHIMSFDAKWKLSSTAYESTPSTEVSNLENFVRDEIVRLAVECFKVFKLRDYGTIDFRLGKDKVPYVIDINPNPCINSELSAMPQATLQNGLSYEQFISKFTGVALSRYRSCEGARSRSF